jgi:hypothetical protein
MYGGVSELSFGRFDEYGVIDELPRNILATYLPGQEVGKSAGNIYLPAIHTKLPDVGDISVHIKLMGVATSQINTNALAGVLEHPTAIIEQPIISALTHHLEHDVEQGALIGGSAAMLLQAMLAYRKSRQYNSTIEQEVANRFYSRSQRALAVLALSATVGSAMFFETSRTSVPAETVPIGSDLVGSLPFLAGASISGRSPLAELDRDLSAALADKKAIDSYYQRVEHNVTAELQVWQSNPANQALLGQAGLKRVLSLAGLHCSLPTGLVVAPEVMRLLKLQIIVNSGNVDVSDGTLPFESYCVTLLQSGLEVAVKATDQSVYEEEAEGSHDISKQLAQLSKP